MFVAALFFLYIFGGMGITYVICTGILHISLWIEEKRDEKKQQITRKERYSKMFEYMKQN